MSPEIGLAATIGVGDPALNENDGIRADSDWGYSINYGYYGSWGQGIPIAAGEGRGFFAASSIELIGPGVPGRMLANELWERRGEIAQLVAREHTDPTWGDRHHKIPACRLTARRADDGSLTIAEYDYRHWRATLPAQDPR